MMNKPVKGIALSPSPESGNAAALILTGGIDSRLTACMLDSAVFNFEVAISGRPNIPDVMVSETTARILGKEFPEGGLFQRALHPF